MSMNKTINKMLEENQEWIDFHNEKLSELRDRRVVLENLVKLNHLNKNKLK